MDLQILPVETEKPLIENENDLVFGKLFTDRMFVMEFDRDKGWHSARIQPYAPLQLDPAAVVLHYSQEIFEGLKAFRRPNGDVALFRPEDNVARFNRSARRMCMPEVDEQFFLDSMLQLIRLEERWIPHNEGTSLYIRPTMIATEAMLGVHPADKYLCYIILSPVGAYYKGGSPRLRSGFLIFMSAQRKAEQVKRKRAETTPQASTPLKRPLKTAMTRFSGWMQKRNVMLKRSAV